MNPIPNSNVSSIIIPGSNKTKNDDKHLEGNAQKCINKLTKYLLGEDWYIVDPVSNYQANEIITHEILMKYSSKYAKEQNKIKHNKKLENGVRLFRIFGLEICIRR